MDAQRHFIVAFLVRKFQIKAFRHGEVHLVGRQRNSLPITLQILHVDLGTIESRLIFRFHIRHVPVLHGAAHHLFGLEPQAFVIHIFLAKARLAVQLKPHHVFFNAKEFEVF